MQDVPLSRTPDFYSYPERPLDTARIDDEFVVLEWPDGESLRVYSLWLFENRMGDAAIEERTRECKLDPADLPVGTVMTGCSLDPHGDLLVHWRGDSHSRHHSGWLRHVAEGHHRPGALIPLTETWTTAEFDQPFTMDGTEVVSNPDAMREWLSALCRLGLVRLDGLPTTKEVLPELGRTIGALRDTNFGTTWPVSVDMAPTSTANTPLPLPPHTDLPTRETPPGFQFLHCLVNTCEAGFSTMADGYAVADHIRLDEPDTYEALTTLNWVFFNRSPDHDHRWSGPIIDPGGPGVPLTLRAFHPVRAFPDMADADIPRAYRALRTFSRIAGSDRFQMRYPFRAGDLIAFDNRRILHGRQQIDAEGGRRELHGTYIDHDEVHSRLRVLTRHHEARWVGSH